jgi:hypothetical protein
MRTWLRWQIVLFRLWRRRQSERAAMVVAWRLPRWLVYWASIRLMAHATTGQYSDTEAPALLAMDALKRWE